MDKDGSGFARPGTGRAGGARGSGLSRVVASLALGTVVLFGAPHIADAGVVNGLMRIVGGVLAVPKGVLVGTMSGPPIIGTVVGALTGAVSGVAMVAGGALETVTSAVPLAFKALPLLPIFL